MKSELKKVQWPTRKQTVNNTVIVDHLLHHRWHLYLAVRCPRRRVITALLDLFGKG